MEIIYGLSKNRLVVEALRDKVNELALNGTLYFGYPVISSADDKFEIDALMISDEHGLVAFLISDEIPQRDNLVRWKEINDMQDRLYYAIESNLSRHDSLRARRRLGVTIQTVTLFPAPPDIPENITGTYCDINGLVDVLADFAPIPVDYKKALHAAFQRVTTIKPVKKREKVTSAISRGAILKTIEKEIANLDQWQKRAAIESPEGPQRVRGLAGSGKTVVLALKAAYLHSQHPDWNIAITFHSRALYPQLIDLIRRFSFEHTNDEPDWNRLRVLHSWGSRERDGIYTEIAKYLQFVPRDFLFAKSRFGMENAFTGVCSELLSLVKSNQIVPIYDAVLVDEAQDLPASFFQLIYHLTKPPKRIVWAYDELQKLSEAGMPSMEELFGVNEAGAPNVQLSNIEGQPREDIILPVCYRNTPWALTLAHALGFGIFRKDSHGRNTMVQHFDDPSLWLDIGYRLREGELAAGSHVILDRNPTSYPEYFSQLLDPADAVIAKGFNNDIEQAEWVAQSIQKNLTEDELEADDILIILPSAYLAKKQSSVVIEALLRRGINAHLAGVTTSRDEIFQKQSVAIANIYRSKGNEAPMVYVLYSQYCYSGHELITLRNILFTAITRCRGWVRLCGFGQLMEGLIQEINSVKNGGFQLEFDIPTPEQLSRMRMIHREKTVDEMARIKKAEKGLNDFLHAINRGDLAIESLPLELRTGLAKLMGQAGSGDEEL